MNFADKIFPIDLRCVDYDTYASSPELATAIWHRIRVKNYPDVIWYAASVTIHSRERVSVTIYSMLDSVWGGIGQPILTLENLDTKDFTARELVLVQTAIEKKKRYLAEQEFERREILQREAAIRQLQQELFGE